jgi:hypothetical protein
MKNIIQITITFSYEYESEEEKVVLTIDVSKTSENDLCLHFTHISGNSLYYKRLVNLIKNEFAYCEVNH